MFGSSFGRLGRSSKKERGGRMSWVYFVLTLTIFSSSQPFACIIQPNLDSHPLETSLCCAHPNNSIAGIVALPRKKLKPPKMSMSIGSSPLLVKIPREIRNWIWKFCVGHKDIHLGISATTKRLISTQTLSHPNAIALLLVCKQMRVSPYPPSIVYRARTLK